jgi:hypothetical protein
MTPSNSEYSIDRYDYADETDSIESVFSAYPKTEVWIKSDKFKFGDVKVMIQGKAPFSNLYIGWISMGRGRTQFFKVEKEKTIADLLEGEMHSAVASLTYDMFRVVR